MNHTILDLHHQLCTETECKRNNYLVHLLLYANNDFYLITYNECMQMGNHIDFKHWIISQMIENSKSKGLNYINTNKSMDYKNMVKDVKNGQIFKNKTREVHYIYSNTSKRFAITSERKYIDRVILIDEYEQNYKKTYEYIMDLLPSTYTEQRLQIELDQLYEANKIHIFLNEIERVKTTDLLIKKIQNEIKH